MDSWQNLLDRVWNLEQGGGGGGGTLTVESPGNVFTGGAEIVLSGTGVDGSVTLTLAAEGALGGVTVVASGDQAGSLTARDAGVYQVVQQVVVQSEGDNTNMASVPIQVATPAGSAAGLLQPADRSRPVVLESMFVQFVPVEAGGIVAVEPPVSVYYDDPDGLGTLAAQAVVVVSRVYNA